MTFSLAISRVADILDRTDVNTQIADSMNTALRKIERKLNLNYMLTSNVAAVVLSGSAYTTPYPTRLKQFASFKVFSGTDFMGDVQFTSRATAYAAYPDVTNDTGIPEFASLLSESSMVLLRPTADVSYNLWYSYWAYSAPLIVDSNESHWILTNFEDLLIYGTLVEMVPILKDWDRDTIWRGRFNEVISDLRKEEMSQATSLGYSFVEGAYAAK